jgi:hypothetical protein
MAKRNAQYSGRIGQIVFFMAASLLQLGPATGRLKITSSQYAEN